MTNVVALFRSSSMYRMSPFLCGYQTELMCSTTGLIRILSNNIIYNISKAPKESTTVAESLQYLLWQQKDRGSNPGSASSKYIIGLISRAVTPRYSPFVLKEPSNSQASKALKADTSTKLHIQRTQLAD